MSSSYGRQEDDLSAIMMRGATDLRNAKFEIGEKHREIALLQSQLDHARKEKDEVSSRLKAVKEAAQRSLQASCSSLEAMRCSVDDLKTQSDVSFSTINDARSSLANVQELRADIATSLQSIAPYLEGGEEWGKAKDMKSIIDTLELECQQVADLLRDRLQCVGGELAEAKNRISELEVAQGEDRAALSRANVAIAQSGSDVASLAECVKKQRTELYDTLSIAAESEAKLAAAKERIRELHTLIERQRDQLKASTEMHEECVSKLCRYCTVEILNVDRIVRLQAILAEKEAFVTELNEARKE
ncbi:hypothetical protein BN946_scf184908.g23 [Trametes cinnabarina]|uniref:SWI5-dependent HO expression protein 3 n=1 Tax=Pycnoporus cinnabarinus TaxID=5643 RepID=A0A060SAK6_PYCCI|nr:hypothetical protein BN946_scf184908.g23 [Trametes cinnabarina]